MYLPAAAQPSLDSFPLSRVPDISLETVKGDNITLSNMQKEGFIFLLIPKPESKTEGQNMIKKIRLWMQKLSSKTGQIFSVMIIEPFKTSFPFYSIQKEKLKRETYPVVIDKDGEILRQFGLSEGKPHIMVSDGNLKIIGSSSIDQDAAAIEKKVELINELLSN